MLINFLVVNILILLVVLFFKTISQLSILSNSIFVLLICVEKVYLPRYNFKIPVFKSLKFNLFRNVLSLKLVINFLRLFFIKVL